MNRPYASRALSCGIKFQCLLWVLCALGPAVAETLLDPSPPKTAASLTGWVHDNSATAGGVRIETRVFIPANHKVLRGLIVSSPGFGGDGRGFATQDRTKGIADNWGFAALGVKFPGSRIKYIYADQGSGRALLKSIRAHAASSGHLELGNAPLLLFGFSHGGAFSYSFTLWRPSRVIAFACNKSGYATTAATTAAARAVPGMFFFGENDEPSVRPRMTQILLANRSLGALWSLAVDWGVPHAPGTANNLIFPFFDEAIKLRVPQGVAPISGPVSLTELSELSGYLGENMSFGSSSVAVASYETFGGDKGKASWFPSAVIANKWHECVSRHRGCPD